MNHRNYSHEQRVAHTTMLRHRNTGAAISHLPSLVRWIMLLGGSHGLSTKEIANLSSASLETIKSIQNRGHQLVEAELQTLI